MTESLFLGPMVIRAAPRRDRVRLRAIAAQGGRDGHGPAMQPVLPLVPMSWARREIESRRALVGAVPFA